MFEDWVFSCPVMSNSLWLHGLQDARIPCPSPFRGVCSNSCPLSWWCHTIILSSVVPFSSSLQSFPKSGSFLMSWLLTSCDQSIGASVSASVLPMNVQGWVPLDLTGLISLQSKGLPRVLSNTTVQKHRSSALSFLYGPVLTSIHDYWKNHTFDYTGFCWQSNFSAFSYAVQVGHSFSSKEQVHFLFLDSKITVNGDCSHEIGRKANANLDSVLKSRDITCQQRSI